MASAFRVVLVTAPRAKADALAQGIVRARLAACVNVVAGVVSHYRWKGRVRRDRESLLVIKTRAAALARLEAWLDANHPYEVPEMIALPIVAGSKPYLSWLGMDA
ncbi:MAG: divalent-cation tolerance protein CutA [Elusimicrobia bacterium]|nr:divalent-cation tolerance protein CutA [Elusimicrobiota bacterium]